MMTGEHSLQDEDCNLNQTAEPKPKPKKRGQILGLRLPLSPASRAALRIQKKILNAISADQERKSKARKRKYLASKLIDEEVL